MATIKQVREFCAKTFPRYKIDSEGRIMRWQTKAVEIVNARREVIILEKGWHFVGWINHVQCMGPDSVLCSLPKELLVNRPEGVFAA